ncbi:MAG: hypothetical protein R3D57_19905 [Hyphomicrobiaceae bacterium]
MLSTIKQPLLAALVLIAGVTAAGAEQRTFNSPMHPGGNRLDWCLDWATGCGKPAADRYCQAVGYSHATSFGQAANVPPTRLIGTGAVCDQAECDSFSFLTCTRPDPQTTYNNPQQGGYRLDWCLSWATDCGKPAADAFCRAQGHQSAAAFQKAPNVPPTRLISTGAVCDQPGCDSFAKIVCNN